MSIPKPLHHLEISTQYSSLSLLTTTSLNVTPPLPSSCVADMLSLMQTDKHFDTEEIAKFEAMAADGVSPKAVRVDGGMVANDWMCQMLSDVLGISVERPKVTETTALGAAYLAGLQSGIYRDLDHIAENWHLDASFNAKIEPGRRAGLLAGWKDAVRRVQTDPNA